MEALSKDIRYALRQLRKAPGFTATVVLTLTLGIGVTTAIFTLVYDVLLRPLPYPEANRLAVMEEVVAEFRDMYPRLPMNANHFENWQRNNRTIESMAMMEDQSMPMGLGGHPLQVEVVSATPGIFSVLRIAPKLGRAFTVQEAQPGHEHVVILTNDLWRTQFHSNAGIVGQTITLDGFPYTVIGVMPPSFHLPIISILEDANTNGEKPAEALIPMAFSKDRLDEAMGDFNYFGVARLKPGISLAQATAEINSLQHTISASLPADEKGTLSAHRGQFDR